MSTNDVDEYLAALDEPKRSTLEQLRQTIAEIIPEAEQAMSYGVPAFKIAGTTVAGFSAAKSWLSYLPHSGTVLSTIPAEDLTGLTASKGALRVPVDQPLPASLVRTLIEARRSEAHV